MASPASPRTIAPSSPAAALWVVGAASAVVISAALVTSFRLPVGQDLVAVAGIRAPRVLLGAGAGALLCLAGAIRLERGRVRPLGELALFAATTFGAGAGFLAAEAAPGAFALAVFAVAALAAIVGVVPAIRALDRPRPATNLVAAGLLVAGIGAAALAGTYARARADSVAAAVAWMLGDLGGASVASGLALVGMAVLALAVAARLAPGPREGVALVALGAAAGAVGPVAFVGTLAPRAVRALAPGASSGALLAASALAGAATLVAVDAVPRLLVGGYDFPLAVPVGMLAIPIFLAWNRARLRREAGPPGRAFAWAEAALIVALSLAGAWLVVTLSRVIRIAT